MKVGFVASAFDLLHAGHIVMLGECKDHCDQLIVALHVDPSSERSAKNKPIETVFERYLRLNSCKFIDRIVPYETEEDLLNMLKIFKPDVRFLGSDYLHKDFTGKELPIEIIYLDREHTFSSSSLRDRIMASTK